MKRTIISCSLVLLTLHASFAQSTNPSPYCDASFDDAQGFWVEDFIKNVTFGTLTNASNGQYAAPHYVYYNNLAAAKFTRNQAYDLSITFDVKGGCGYGVWIDYNQNNIFEPNEKITGTTGTNILDLGANTTITKNVTIPNDAKLGKTRMRIRIVEDDMFVINSSEILPCNLSNSNTDVMDWGETEDYDVEITTNTPPTSINSIQETLDLAVYPNPASESINITSTQTIDQVTITNSLGMQVYNMENIKKTNVSISNTLPNGLYYLNVTAGNVTERRKIVIAR